MTTDCCYQPSTTTNACGCCEGVEALTPLPTRNRPGLPSLSYRIGTHATFLETMKARLSNSDYSKLAELTTRAADDPSISMLDAWATVADVLTFYQERIANEGYLRTATERRSVLELARLVGYQPRPGVSSSVYLAYTLDDNFKEEATIPKGARSQSIPGPGEIPQSFETSEDVKARAQWSKLKPRMTRPQSKETIDPDRFNSGTNNEPRVYLKGIVTNLQANDPLLIDFGLVENQPLPTFYRVKSVKPEPDANRTLVTLQSIRTIPKSQFAYADPNRIIKTLTKLPSIQAQNSIELPTSLVGQFKANSFVFPPATVLLNRTLIETANTTATTVSDQEPPEKLAFSAVSETAYAVAKVFSPQLKNTFATAIANANVTPQSAIKVYAMRIKAVPFGHNAPLRPSYFDRKRNIVITDEWDIQNPLNVQFTNLSTGNIETYHRPDQIFLDSEYNISPKSWLVIDNPNKESPQVVWLGAQGVSHQSLAAYGITGKSTRLDLSPPNQWISESESFSTIRSTTIYAQSEELDLADEPIEEFVCSGTDPLIELDCLIDGLTAGRWVIVSGECTIDGTSGVQYSELAMIDQVVQDVQKTTIADGNNDAVNAEPLPGDKTHTFIKLAKELQYCYKRETVTIYSNVVMATHGETRKEVLGAGDGAKALQCFVLKQPPLTFVSASNPAGVDSTLSIFVNDIKWLETDTLEGLSHTDRNFITKTDDDGKTTVVFGNGRKGARLPTGIENIKAEYRNGIGKLGNVKAGQITLLTTRPLGVKEVINPLQASGGANKETRDQARKNAPLAVMALDRLVSVQDYEDFSRIYAGIGKARAVEISDGRRQLVHITIAGTDNISIDKSSDLYRNLHQSLLDFGDPYQAIKLEIRELMLIVISANICILPEYQWKPVVTQVRSALLDAFSFDRRELGQDVLLSEVVSVMQSVQGVVYVDVDTFGGIPEIKLDNIIGERRPLTPEEISKEVVKFVGDSVEPRLRVNLADYDKDDDGNIVKDGKGNIAIHPAQLAFLTSEVPETLILNQIA